MAKTKAAAAPQREAQKKAERTPPAPAAVQSELPRPSKAVTAAICLGLAVLTVAVYFQVRSYGFVMYDDGSYVYDNARIKEGPTLENVKWAFTTFFNANWHPFVWLSLMLDCRLFGLNPGAMHLVNVGWHVAAALLLFLAFARMTRRPWRSAIVAGVFAVHPMHVESVAWIAERKDVLHAFFAALALFAYARYAERPSVMRMLPVMLALACGLMAKSMLVTLPFVLLLLDLWPLGRLKWRPTLKGLMPLVAEKIPLFAMSGATSVLTYLAQQRGGAVSDLIRMPFSQRLANVSISYLTYVLKALWPLDLGVMYPILIRPAADAVGAFIFVAAVTAGVLAVARKRPYCLVGWLWFLGMLVPVIGMVTVGAQLMADRYMYLPLVGLSFAVVWLVGDLCGTTLGLRRLGGAVGLVAIVLFAASTFRQAGFWRTSAALFQHTIDVTCPNPIMHTTLGAVYSKEGQRDKAISEYRKAIEILPSYADAHSALATIYYHEGSYKEAMDEYNQALQYQSDLPQAHNNIGAILDHWGRHDEAMKHYQAATASDPDYTDAHTNLGMQYYMHGKPSDAEREYRIALSLQPDSADSHKGLGLVLEQLGKTDEAMAQYEKAIALKGDFADAHAALAHAVFVAHAAEAPTSKWYQYGYTHLMKALELDPSNYVALATNGLLLAAQGKLEDARKNLEASLKVNGNQTEARTNLAFVLIYLNRFDDAVLQCREALKIDPKLANAHYNLGLAFSCQNKLDEAAAEFRASLASKPDQPQAQNLLAATLIRMGRWDEAIAACNEAIKLDPNAVESHFNLAVALSGKGDNAAAQAEYSKILARDPQNAAAKAALDKLGAAPK